MVDKVENPKAFPVFIDKGQFGFEAHLGMSLRDWFAAAALSALIPIAFKRAEAKLDAEAAYEYADAMLAARGQS